MERRKYDVRHDVRGPAGEAGFLLIAPPSEELDWDVQHEIASTCRHWVASQQAWWIAAPYLSTAYDIMGRLQPEPEPGPAWRRQLHSHLSRAAGVRLAWLVNLGSTPRSGADRALS